MNKHGREWVKKIRVVALTPSTNICHYVLWEKKKSYYKWVHYIGLLDKCTSAVLHSWLFNLLADFLPCVGYRDPSTEWVLYPLANSVNLCALWSLSVWKEKACFLAKTQRSGLVRMWLHTKWRKLFLKIFAAVCEPRIESSLWRKQNRKQLLFWKQLVKHVLGTRNEFAFGRVRISHVSAGHCGIFSLFPVQLKRAVVVLCSSCLSSLGLETHCGAIA